MVLSIGDSMRDSAAALQQKNPQMRHHHFPHLHGLSATDDLVSLLLAETGFSCPPPAVARWRKRLQDAMLDCHFSLGQTRFLLCGEPDQVSGIATSLREAGGKIDTLISTTRSAQLQRVDAAELLVGDLGDAEERADRFDLVVGNFHAEAMAHRLHKGLLLRGYPNWEQVGNQLKCDVLYEGGCNLLFEAANIATHIRERH